MKFIEFLNEGTWAFPKKPDQIKKFNDLINKMRGGKADKNWKSQLYHIFGDDDLFDKIDRELEFYKKEKTPEAEQQKHLSSIIQNEYRKRSSQIK